MNRKVGFLYFGWLVFFVALGLTMVRLATAGDRPECPPGVVCELPTQTPPVEVTSEPYPYPAGHARPTPGERVYLSPVMGESSP